MNFKPLPGNRYPLIAGCVDPRGGLDTLEKRNIFATAGIERRFIQSINCSLHHYTVVLPDWTHKALSSRSCICEDIKSRLKAVNACYHSVKRVLCSSVLTKNVKLITFWPIILSVYCMGVKLGLSHWGRNVG
jgi:hypothetical protein